jgi:serine/threonine-protein kinase
MQTISVDRLVGKNLGDYRVEQMLGQGKMSAVYMARQLSLGRIVMVTTFTITETLSKAAYERFTARFTQVGSSLITLNHPHILPIYDCGVQYGTPYLVTSFVKGGSLAQILRQQARFSPEQALHILQQISEGLDYVHEQGFVHGILNPANILVNDKQMLQITGFGLKQMLQMQGIEDNNDPATHLLSIAGTFLGSPEYIAPECVTGSTFDARADVYALGTTLFELLSGSPPFTGSEPLEIANKRLHQPVPSLHEVCPDIPAAYDLILYHALECEPEKRYKHAGEIAKALERVLKILEGAAKNPATKNTQTTNHSEMTLPPTVNWFDEEIISTRKWQLIPPVVTGHLATVQGGLQASKFSSTNGEQQVNEQDQVVRLLPSSEKHLPADAQNLAAETTDPFVWWAATSPKTQEKTPGTFARNASKRPTSYNANKRRKASVRERRQVVVGLLTGTAVVGILGIGGISFARFIESSKQLQVGNTQTALSNSSATQATQGTTQSPTQGTQNTPTGSSTPRTHPSPTKGTQPTPGSTPLPGSTPAPGSTPQPTPKPTQPPPPTPTPTPPQHTGTVIGHTNMATNSSVSFTNPADGQGGLLIHLSNGNFVACERACTHAGVPVNYDAGSGKLLCPAHGAIFDPANAFSVVQGPANKSLPVVSIRVNADGTITTG